MDFLNALVAILNYVVVPASAYGAQLALGALGVTLIYGILRFSNFAHGDTMAFGTAITIIVTWGLQSLGVSFGPLPTALIALPFGIAATAALVLATDRMVYAYYRKVRAAPVILVMVSVGVMILRRRQPARPRPFRTPLVWIVCPLAVAGCVLLFVNLSVIAKIVFVVWAIIGLIFYRLYGYSRSQMAPHNAGRAAE